MWYDSFVGREKDRPPAKYAGVNEAKERNGRMDKERVAVLETLSPVRLPDCSEAGWGTSVDPLSPPPAPPVDRGTPVACHACGGDAYKLEQPVKEPFQRDFAGRSRSYVLAWRYMCDDVSCMDVTLVDVPRKSEVWVDA